MIPGHGEPSPTSTPRSSARIERTAAFEADDARVARHALKVAADVRAARQAAADAAAMPAYVDRVGIYRDFNERFFRMPAASLARMLQNDLQRAGAVRLEDGWLSPA